MLDLVCSKIFTMSVWNIGVISCNLQLPFPAKAAKHYSSATSPLIQGNNAHNHNDDFRWTE